MATGEDAIKVLEAIRDLLVEQNKLLRQGFRLDGPHAFTGTQGGVASDADLDGQYGNPEVKAKSPRDWTGESMQGRRFSECPAEYLDMVAARLDYFAETNAASENADDRKKAGYNRKDAARARGWAARIRAGYVAPVAESGESFGGDDGGFGGAF